MKVLAQGVAKSLQTPGKFWFTIIKAVILS